MDILLISNEDMCRTRIAQELINSFGRGMKIFTAGIAEGNCVPDVVSEVMHEHGYEISKKKPSPLSMYIDKEWDCIITLSTDAAKEISSVIIKSNNIYKLNFEDALSDMGLSEDEIKNQVSALYEDMYHDLYEFYRDTLSDFLRPRCSCGANDYCRCE